MDFSQVAQAERQLDIAHTRASDRDLPCPERGVAGARAEAAAERVCELARERADADLERRCDAARRQAEQARALATRGCDDEAGTLDE